MPLPKLNITIEPGAGAGPEKNSVLFIPIFSDQDAASVAAAVQRPELKETFSSLKESAVFSAESGEIWNQQPDGYILAGLGSSDDFHPDKISTLFRNLGKYAIKYKNISISVLFSERLSEVLAGFSQMVSDPDSFLVKSRKKTEESQLPDYLVPITLPELISQAVVALIVGSDSMDILAEKRKKREINPGKIYFYTPKLSTGDLRAAVVRGCEIGRALNGARYIASLPANHFNPEDAENYAREIAEEFGLKIEVFDASRLKKMGCHGILSVGQGSEIPPRMITLEYKPENSVGGRVALIGKGITFDSGGISIKPSEKMHEMKYDMCGSALALHTIALAAARKLPVEIVCLLGFAENLPSGNAVKPGDVYTAYNGVTVEVQNTDAEGRLLLGDILAYASKNYSPSMMVDFATLTGACVIALGHDAGGLLTPSEKMAGLLESASRRSLDRIWRLPHWSIYDEGLKSDVADIRNIAGRAGGTVTAMRFLSKFVDSSIHWAHVDIAGTAWRDSEGGSQCKGATGWGIRLMNQFLEDIAGG